MFALHRQSFSPMFSVFRLTMMSIGLPAPPGGTEPPYPVINKEVKENNAQPVPWSPGGGCPKDNKCPPPTLIRSWNPDFFTDE